MRTGKERLPRPVIVDLGREREFEVLAVELHLLFGGVGGDGEGGLGAVCGCGPLFSGACCLLGLGKTGGQPSIPGFFFIPDAPRFATCENLSRNIENRPNRPPQATPRRAGLDLISIKAKGPRGA